MYHVEEQGTFPAKEVVKDFNSPGLSCIMHKNA